MNSLLLRHPETPGSGDSGAGMGLSGPSAELLERYLDGQLTEQERRNFENSLESDPVLRKHLGLQKQIDARLLARFSPLNLPEATHQGSSRTTASESVRASHAVASPQTSRTAAKPARTSWTRIAAMVAIIMGGYFLYQNLSAPNQSPTYAPGPSLTPVAAYAREVKGGMQPTVICTTSEKFATYTKERLGVALSVKPTDGLALLGWSYEQAVFSPSTITMLATYHDQPIVVFMDKGRKTCLSSTNDKVDESSRSVGGVFLYEIRPKGTPSMLDQFAVSDK